MDNREIVWLHSEIKTPPSIVLILSEGGVRPPRLLYVRYRVDIDACC